MLRTRDAIRCIIPPQVLDRIARNGSSEQRRRALDTISLDHSLRVARLQNAFQAAARAAKVDVLGMQAELRPKRTIYDARNGDSFFGNVVRAEGAGPTGDVAVDEAYDGLGATYDFYANTFQRDSIDGRGLPLDGVVHFRQDYDNAFWDGQRMVFGDGDNELFNRFTIALDIIGHELTHGVTEVETGLNYWQQSGALNESISDAFGSLVKQQQLGQKADEADWLIGAGLLAAGVQGDALRSMKAPGTAYDDPILGKDEQPGHMNDYVNTFEDNGGVHTNSGIPNRAFYLAATAIGGYAWETPGRIWFSALQDPRVHPTTRFRGFARATLRAAATIYGSGSTEQAAVAAAWEGVGVNVG